MSRWDELWEKPEPAPRPPPTDNPINGERREAWLHQALDGEIVRMLAAPVGARNNLFNTVAFTMGGHVGPGRLSEERVVEELWEAGRKVELPDHEIAKILPRSVRQGAEKPFELPDLDDGDEWGVPPVSVLGPAPGASREHPTAGAGPDAGEEPHVEFWRGRAMLWHIHRWARSRRVSPWAVLGVLLARVATATPWTIGLPPVLGSYGSLNTFVGLVGASGSGKSAAMAVASESVNLGELHELKIGSGEGIAHTYRKREKDGTETWRVQAALFEVPEVDMLTALGQRQGSTLLPELRSAWTGERLGFGYADLGKRLLVPAHTYRLCMVVAIQPRRARPLLDAADAGTPQRFLWMPALDRFAPDVAPVSPDRVRWHPPAWDDVRRGWRRSYDGVSAMPVAGVVHEVVSEAFMKRLRGDADALDGHALLCREKVAAGLALLDDRVEISVDDWELAGVVMAVSDETRDYVRRELLVEQHEAEGATNARELRKSVTITEGLEKAALARVSRNLTRYLTAHTGWIAWGTLRRDALRSADRKLHFETAIAGLLELGYVEARESGGGVQYRLREAK